MVSRQGKKKKSLIYNEFSDVARKDFFDLKTKKFVQYIDSFYYCIYLDAQFSSDAATDERVENLRRVIRSKLEECRFNDNVVFRLPNLPLYFTCHRAYYGRMYNFMLRRADHYVIYIADTTFTNTTPQILVQIESQALWMDGIRESLENTLEDVRTIADAFGFTIVGAFENRIDYCWHTNYLDNPELFLRSDNFAKHLVSRLRSSFTHEEFRGNERYEIDYRTLGVRKSNNVFFRFYNKAKEVVEKKNNTKGFFLKLWYLNEVINRYDLYVLEKCYEKNSWIYMDKARLEFYLEYGNDVAIKKTIDEILSGKKTMNSDALHGLAEMLTPKVTSVYNVEFQTMRKFSTTLELEDSDYNLQRYGAVCRLFTILDDWRAICNTLTESVVRLVEPEGDENKSRRPDCPFWAALRRSRNIAFKHYTSGGRVLRSYQHQKDADLVKRRALSGIVSWNLYMKGLNEDSAESQMIDFLNHLSDDDYNFIIRSRLKKVNGADYSDNIGLSGSSGKYHFFDEETGEFID